MARDFFRWAGSARSLLGLGLRGALPLAVALLLGSAWPAFGQFASSNGRLVVRSDGFIFWLQDGRRHVVYPATLSDEEINAVPEAVPLNASLLPPSGPGVPAASDPAQRGPGTSRLDRLPRGQACECSIIRGTGPPSDLLISVVSLERNAWPRLQRTHPTNQLPRDGFEYIVVTLNIKYASGPRDLPVSIDRFDFSVLDSSDVLHVPAFVVEPQALTSTSAYPGTEITGAIAYQIPQGDPDPVLVWRYNDESPIWFAVQ